MGQTHSSAQTEAAQALRRWWGSPAGRALIAAETLVVAEALDDVFGWECLQIGAWGEGRQLLGACRTRHRAILARPGLSDEADILGRPSQLPVLGDSIDAVLMPHTLEFASDPYAIVRETDRVLVGEGHLVVLGFQPWSLWGRRARFSRSGFPPGLRRVLSERRLREWLALLGYEVFAARRYLYRSPWAGGLAAGEGADRLLRRGLTFPLPAGAYLLKARKQVYTLTPMRPRLRKAMLGGLVKPTPPVRHGLRRSP